MEVGGSGKMSCGLGVEGGVGGEMIRRREGREGEGEGKYVIAGVSKVCVFVRRAAWGVCTALDFATTCHPHVPMLDEKVTRRFDSAW